jgi:peptide/nickel transport system ATP-binding protein
MLIEKLIIKDENHIIVDLLKEIDSTIEVKQSLALVGQSGSGKSLTIKAILNLLPNNLTSEFGYKSDFELSFENLGFIPQNPFTSLSPMTKIKNQFFVDDMEIDKYLNLVGLEYELKNRFPVELSGGQLQRVIIAITLCKKPKLLLLDEPTTALDESTKELILDLLIDLQKQLDFKMVFVSHDIDSIENICEDIAIINNGSVCEYGKMKDIIQNPKKEYTKILLKSNFKNREFRV